MKNKRYYPVAHSLNICEIVSIMCEDPSEETLARMDEEEVNYHDDELLSIHHAYKHSYMKPESISKAKYENDIYKVERPYQFYTEDAHERRVMFNAYCQDYLDCGDNIEPRDNDGYLVHVGEYSFHVNNPSDAWHYIYG